MRTRIAYHVMTRKALAARGGYHSVYDCISQLIANCVDYADDSKPPQWSENPATWAELVGKDVVAFSAKMPVTST